MAQCVYLYPSSDNNRATISGHIWEDISNIDGVYADGVDVNVAGVIVNIDDRAGNLYTAVTNSNGIYTVDVLKDREYLVTYVRPAGLGPSVNATIDTSNASIGMNHANGLPVYMATSNRNIDFALQRLQTIMDAPPCATPIISYSINSYDITQLSTVNITPIVLTGFPLSISGEGFPTGVTIDASTGIITGNPTIPGVYNSQIVVTNFCGQFKHPITFNIIEVCHPPASYYHHGYDINRNDIINIDVVSGGTMPITYTSTTLPSGMFVDSATGHISGSPQITGSFTSTIIATNSCGQEEIIVYFNVLPSENDCTTNEAYPDLAIVEDGKSVIFTFVNNIPNPTFQSSCSDSIITLQGSNQLSDGCWVHTVSVKGINNTSGKEECTICLVEKNKCVSLVIACKAKKCGKRIKLTRDEINASFFRDKCIGVI